MTTEIARRAARCLLDGDYPAAVQCASGNARALGFLYWCKSWLGVTTISDVRVGNRFLMDGRTYNKLPGCIVEIRADGWPGRPFRVDMLTIVKPVSVEE